MGWEKLIALDDLTPNAGREFTVGDRIIALFRTESGVFAVDGMCAHAGGPLAKGTVTGTVVTCPWHGWQYDVSTGRYCLNSLICQQSYPVSIRSGDVHVELP